MRRLAPTWFTAQAALPLTALLALLPFVLLLGLVEARWQPLRALDRGVTETVQDLVAAQPAVATIMQTVTYLGDGVTWWVLLSVTTLYLLVRRHRRIALFVAVTGIGGGLLNLAVKAGVGRARPDLAEPVSYASGFAFPSGHTMNSAIGMSVLLIVFLPLLAPRWRFPAVAAGTLFALAVGLSRIVLGVHWASDVVGGWLLSLAWVLAMVAIFRAWQREPRTGRSQQRPTVGMPQNRHRHG